MTPEQQERMEALEEKLTEVVLRDADPDNWTGAGIIPSELSQAERGDAYWCRKMAVSTLLVFTRVRAVLDPASVQRPGANQREDDLAMDAEIKASEKEASKLLNEIQTGARKAAFTKKAHGK